MFELYSLVRRGLSLTGTNWSREFRPSPTEDVHLNYITVIVPAIRSRVVKDYINHVCSCSFSQNDLVHFTKTMKENECFLNRNKPLINNRYLCRFGLLSFMNINFVTYYSVVVFRKGTSFSFYCLILYLAIAMKIY